MYVITQWQKRYEVNTDGRAAKKGDKVCKRLDFVRLTVFGRKQGAGYNKMGRLVGNERRLEVFGLFCKLLEIAADQPPELRGAILNADDLPATESDIAEIVGAPPEITHQALADLVAVGWLTRIDCRPETDTDTVSRILAHPRGYPRENVVSMQENEPNPKQTQELTKKPGDILADFSDPSERNETKRNENEIELELNETTRARARARAREGPSPKDPPPDATPASIIARADSSSTRLDSSRRGLDFGNALRDILCPKGNADLKALWNLQHWTDQQASGTHERILAIARDSKGRNPLAVFFSRVTDELGYRPRAERDKQHA